MGIETFNPQGYRYIHPNFAPRAIVTTLQKIDTDNATLKVQVDNPDGLTGIIQLSMGDGGGVLARIHRNASNPITVLVVGDGGETLFEG